MRKILAAMLSLFLLWNVAVSTALADRMYLIADSNKRKLTYEELWGWDYESLGYILNEIFARHGYVFESGGKYEYYFNCMPWYTPNASSNNRAYCYPKLNDTEWYNEHLVKEVRADMRAIGTRNKGGHSVWTGFSTGFDVLQGFDYVSLKAGQKLAVYSAPSDSSWRGANGKALINTNGAVYTAGWENGWMLVMYETNKGAVRVGYVDGSRIKGKNPVTRSLNFQYTQSTVFVTANLTDDPATGSSRIMTLREGAEVTYLSTFFNNQSWDYVETTLNGQQVRGFIPAGCLDVGFDDTEDDDLGNG